MIFDLLEFSRASLSSHLLLLSVYFFSPSILFSDLCSYLVKLVSVLKHGNLSSFAAMHF